MNNYNLPELLKNSTRAIREFLASEEFFKFVYETSRLAGLGLEGYVELLDYFNILTLKGFSLDEAEEKLIEFLPNLNEDQKKIIIRELAVNFVPLLEKLWEIKPEDEEYEDKVQRYIKMMEAFLIRPSTKIKREELKNIEEEKEPVSGVLLQQPQEVESSRATKENEEAEVESVEEPITISWQAENQKNESIEKNQVEPTTFAEIPQISFKIKEEKEKEEKEEPIDLSQI